MEQQQMSENIQQPPPQQQGMDSGVVPYFPTGEEVEINPEYARWLLDNQDDIETLYFSLTGRTVEIDPTTHKSKVTKNKEFAMINDAGAMQLVNLLRVELSKVVPMSNLREQLIQQRLFKLHIEVDKFLAFSREEYEIRNRGLIEVQVIDVVESNTYRSKNGWEGDRQRRTHKFLSATRNLTSIPRGVQRNQNNMF